MIIIVEVIIRRRRRCRQSILCFINLLINKLINNKPERQTKSERASKQR
jgi:hypothetical protein